MQGSSNCTASAPKSFAAPAPRPHVCLRAPAGIGQVPMLSGIRRTVVADDTVEMTEADAAPLLRAGWLRADADRPAGTGSGGLL